VSEVARGERNGRAKLTCEQALDIHLLARSKRYWQRELAEAFGVSQSHVSLIEHRRRWQWLLPDNNEGNEMSNEEFEARLAASEKRVAELERQLRGEQPAPQFKPEPYRPIDYTAGASMDRETKRDLATAIPDDLARDLRADLARGNPITQSVAQLTPDRDGGRVQIQRGSGWAPERKLEPPPGIAVMDRLMDMQDAIDKADLERRLARTKE
jgi:transcriptional regulator with XRE-family HTH domain